MSVAIWLQWWYTGRSLTPRSAGAMSPLIAVRHGHVKCWARSPEQAAELARALNDHTTMKSPVAPLAKMGCDLIERANHAGYQVTSLREVSAVLRRLGHTALSNRVGRLNVAYAVLRHLSPAGCPDCAHRQRYSPGVGRIGGDPLAALRDDRRLRARSLPSALGAHSQRGVFSAVSVEGPCGAGLDGTAPPLDFGQRRDNRYLGKRGHSDKEPGDAVATTRFSDAPRDDAAHVRMVDFVFHDAPAIVGDVRRRHKEAR